MKKTFFIFSILIIFFFTINSTKDFSIFDVKNKKSNNKTKHKSSNKKIKEETHNIEDLKNRAKRIACLSLIRNSLKNQTGELKQFLQSHKKNYFSYFKKITDHCKDKITEDQASNILTNKNVTNFNDSFPEYKQLIFNDYIKNLKIDDDFVKDKNKNKNKNKKKGKKKDKIKKILIIGLSSLFLLALLFLFLVFKNKPNSLSKNNIENLNKTKKNKNKID